MSLGYDACREFKPAICINRPSTNEFVILETSDWFILVSFAENDINQHFAQQQNHSTENSSKNTVFISYPNMKISKFTTNHKHFIQIENITMQSMISSSKNNSIVLNQEEWTKCSEYREFFQLIIRQYLRNALYVEQYYQSYLYHCLLKNKNTLDTNDLYTLMDNPISFNYTRLFFEIPLICHDKSTRDLFLMRLTSQNQNWIK